MMKHKDIFISYRNDGVGNNFANRITDDLRKKGYSVYFNPDEVKNGDFPERLRTAIKNCKDFICIVSQSYIKRLQENEDVCWIRDELICAKENDKNIIPILINDTLMPADPQTLPECVRFFSSIDAYIFPEQYVASPFVTLCNVLKSRCDGKNNYRDVYNSSEIFNPNEVLDEMLQKADNGDMTAMLNVGLFYYYGFTGEVNDKKAAKRFKKLSEKSDEYRSMADKFIGHMYYTGSMPREEQSYEKSFEYYLKSAEKDTYSAAKVAYMKSVGTGCEFDYEETEKYYLSVFDTLDNTQKDVLCRFYVNHGEYKKAADIYETMADTYPEAAYQLGTLYKKGVLTIPFKPDYQKAEHLLKIAMDNGHTRAAIELGAMYFRPTGGFKKNFIKARECYEKAAQKGDSTAQYMLGYMYRYGHISKDIEKAIYYFELAAAQGNVSSAANLATLYQIGEYHNYEKAFDYCKTAANRGDGPSKFMLGMMYLIGRGCDADEDKAYIYMKQAYDKGVTEAKLMLDYMDENDI